MMTLNALSTPDTAIAFSRFVLTLLRWSHYRLNAQRFEIKIR